MRRARHGRRSAMYFRMLLRASAARRAQTLTALLAVVVAAAVSTTMLDLYADVGARLSKEFRGYGANLVVVARDGQFLPADALARVDQALGEGGAAVPFAYAVARTASGQPIVVAGTEFDRVRRLDRWWSVSSWPHAAGQALLGARALPLVAPEGKPFVLTFDGRALELMAAGSVRTGAAEDSRVFLDLAEFVKWTGVRPGAIEIGASGSTREVENTARRIAQVVPEAEVHPVRQIVEGEARVLGKARATLLAAALVILLTAALCVLATLTASVLERRRDFAIMKALGASERLVSAFFAGETAALGLAGAAAGFGIGSAVAAWIGWANFNTVAVPHLSLFPDVLAGSMALALLAAALPLALLRRIQPAAILRGE